MDFKNINTDELPIYIVEEEAKELPCEGCRNGEVLSFDFTMAFQPLVDLSEKEVFGYEGLVRGLNDESAYSVIKQVNARNLYRFDQTCLVKAIALAAEANLTKRLNINFMPGAVYKPDICIRTTLRAAEHYGFPKEKITFEIVETEHIADTSHLQGIIDYYKKIGLRTALDDFGSGYANLEWLCDLSPDSIKIDMKLVRGINENHKKKSILRALVSLCKELEIDVLAEGIETVAERDALIELGIFKQQGYFFARPAFEAFVDIDEAKFR